MRIALAALVLVIASSTFDAARADPYRWCAEMGGDRGGTNCWFMTLEQCRWAISGMNSAFCQPNAFYDGKPIVTPAPRARQHR